MFYTYNKKELQFYKFGFKNYAYSILTLFAIIFSSYSVGRFMQIGNLSDYEKNILLINMKQEPFSEDKLISLMKELNIKFPHVVLAQAKLETNNFHSGIFKENHNLFGMKEARIRISTAKGTNRNHAYYDNWESSVYDYAFYQCRYLGGIDTEEEYYLYLGQNYAEAGNYVEVVKATVQREKLKDLF
jgi:hypothetical protein